MPKRVLKVRNAKLIAAMHSIWRTISLTMLKGNIMATVFQKLSKKYGLNQEFFRDDEFGLLKDSVPCYVRRAECPRVMEVEDMVPYLRACARETIGVVILSTTEQEAMHQQWLEAAKQVGAQITAGRSIHHGEYNVWLISLTGTAKKNKE